MSTTDNVNLLRDYAATGSEAAFGELVSRYIDLVYSVAVRRVDGETQLAEEVSQRVFIDLARKARQLSPETMLGGWLHRHTCFVAATMKRTELRRRRREQEAVAMNLLHQDPETDWQQLAPFLDQAIDSLADADREAIVLRFFEQRELRAIGAALGVSEDAAQKRVTRAVEKLRELLTRRGVALSVTTLAALLAAHAVIAAPVTLASQVSQAALAAGSAGVIALVLKLFTPSVLKATALLALVAVTVALLVSRQNAERDRLSGSNTAVVTNDTALVAGRDDGVLGNDVLAVVTAKANPSNILRLTFVAADSGKPVPNVPTDYRGWEGTKFTKKQFQGFRNGIADVEFPRETTTQLELTTRIDGFADTRLLWRPDRGEVIPPNYTLRLVRSVPISGRVVDADGQPVADAKVGFNHEEDPTAKSFPESHEFSWIEVLTDTDGGWSINRVAPEMIRRLYGSARHSEHVGSSMLFVGQNLGAERQLRAGTHVFQLGRALTIRGVVVDSSDQPIVGAKVFVGQRGSSSRREATAAMDGTFAVNGCKPGKNLVSAEADGFAPATIEVEAVPDSGLFRIVLQPGRQLRLRVVDRDGQPIPRASLLFDPPSRAGRTPAAQAESQARFDKSAGQNGEVIWTNAPAGDLYFSVFGKDCMELRDAKVGSEETEHTFTMSPALVVHGSVRDAETGEAIPRFRIVGGWPENRTGEGVLSPHWSNIERHWLNFSGGEFRHTFSEALIMGMPNPGYVLKFEADGYASAVSRLIRPDEVDARVDALLRKGSNTLITVLLPNGRRAADADVGLTSRGAGLELAPARFVRRSSQGALLRTDAQGQFKLSPDPTIERVFLVHEDGYAETTPSVLAKDPVVSLAAWGRLEGKFYRQGKPVVDAELIPGFLNDGRDRSAIMFSFQEYKVRTDADGSYVFQKFPPGHFSLIHLIPSPQPDGRMAWTHGPLGTVEIRPGETTTNDIGVAVCGVTLHVRLPEELARTQNLRVFVTLRTPGPEAPDAILTDAKALATWNAAPERVALLRAMRYHMLSKGADGTWTVQDVPPGEYTLLARVTDDAAKPESKLLGIARRMGIMIPPDAAGSTIDLGELPIETVAPK